MNRMLDALSDELGDIETKIDKLNGLVNDGASSKTISAVIQLNGITRSHVDAFGSPELLSLME